MSFELLKQEVGSEQAQGNPIESVIWSENVSRGAVGTVEKDGETRPIEVQLKFEREEGEENYVLKTKLLDTGRYHSRRYNNRFGADAVFEKIVRDYDLETDPSEEQLERLSPFSSDVDEFGDNEEDNED